MRIHYLQQVPFEGIANIADWAKAKNHHVSGTHLYRGDSLPFIEQLDWLIVMGGPMNIYEEPKYPWLAAEKRFIEKAIKNGGIVIGICLGAQLIADVLGAKVSKNKYKEIGWHHLQLTEEGRNSFLFSGFQDPFIAFHWHGDTFSIPKGARRLASSEACQNQAYEYDNKIFGLQFHLESSEESIKSLIDHSDDELVNGNYVQAKGKMISGFKHLNEITKLMRQMFDNIEKFHRVKINV